MTGDPVLEWMRKHGVPLTRQNYLDLNYLGNPSSTIDPEIEAELPEEVQLPEWHEQGNEEEDTFPDEQE